MGPGYARELSGLTWEELRDLGAEGALGVLPIGAIEAHGPHLPLDTDVIIARAMARAGGARLAGNGTRVLILPAISWSPAPFAEGFPGTVSIRPDTLATLLRDIRDALEAQGIAPLVLANAHLDPAHVGMLRALVEAEHGIVFPDVTRRRWAERLTEEFRSGACHAGRYETSILLATSETAVREDRRRELEPVLHSLTDAMREGRRTFEDAGGPRAYFGDPASATIAEGRETIAVLGEILAEAVHEYRSAGKPGGQAGGGQGRDP